MKIKKSFSPILILLLFVIVGFVKIDGSKNIELIESEVANYIIKNSVPSNKLFYYYSLAARELRKNNYKDLAIKYYKKALAEECEVKDHCIKAQSEFVFILEEEGKLLELKSEVEKLEKLANENGFLKSHPEYQFVIDYFKVIAADDLVKNVIGKDYQYFEDTIYFELILQHEFETRIKKKLFNEAYLMFQVHHHQISQHELRSAHDLLATILNKNPPKWHCLDSLRDFPMGQAPSFEICRLLQNRREQKKLTDISNLKLTIEKSSLRYLLPALSELM